MEVQQTELDYLIYNDPLGYADLILNGDPDKIFEERGREPWVRKLRTDKRAEALPNAVLPPFFTFSV